MTSAGLLPNLVFDTILGKISTKSSKFKQLTENLTAITSDNIITIFETDTLQVKQTITLSFGSKITSIDNQDDKIIVGTSDGILKIYEQEEQKFVEQKTFKFSKSRILVSTEPEKLNIFVATSNKFFKFNYDSEELIFNFEGLTSPVTDFQIKNSKIFAVLADNSLKIFDCSSPIPVGVLASTNKISNLGFFKNFVIFKRGDSIFYFEFLNGEISAENFLIDLKKLKTFKISEENFVAFTNNKMFVYELRTTEKLSLTPIFSKEFKGTEVSDYLIDQKNFLFAYSNNKIESLNRTKKFEAQNFIKFHTSKIFYCKICDQRLISVSGEQILIWKLKNDDYFLQNSYESKSEIKSVAYLNLTDKIFFTTAEKELKSLNFKSLEEKTLETNINYEISFENSLLLKKGSKFVEVSEFDKTKYSLADNFDFFSNKKVFTVDGVICCKISPDKKILAVSKTGNEVWLFNLDNKIQTLKLFGHSLPVFGIDFDLSSNRIYTSSADKLVKVFGLNFGELQKTLLLNSNFNVFFSDKSECFLNVGEEVKLYEKFDFVKKILAAEDSKLLSFYLKNETSFVTGHQELIIYKNAGITYKIEDEQLNLEQDVDIYEGLMSTNPILFEKTLDQLEKVEGYLTEVSLDEREKILQDENYFKDNKDFELELNKLSNLICEIQTNEIENALSFFTHTQVFIILKALAVDKKEENLVKLARIYLSIAIKFEEFLKSFKPAQILKKKIEERILKTREVIGENYGLTMNIK